MPARVKPHEKTEGKPQKVTKSLTGLLHHHRSLQNEMEEAARMWQRMNKENSNSQPPEFLSTHPSNKTRIENIRKWIPEVKKKFKLS